MMSSSSSTSTSDPLSDQNDRALRMKILREALPACQPQEGSPANTFTASEMEELKQVFPNMNIPLPNKNNNSKQQNDRIDITEWKKPQDEEQQQTTTTKQNVELNWYGAPRFMNNNNDGAVEEARTFRRLVRNGNFCSPTNGICPGLLQCNLVVLPQGQHAFDFLLFCQRNPKACPLIEVCDVGSSVPYGVAHDADLRTDIPMYVIYKNGKLDGEVADVTDYWPDDSVAFLIGCSFSCDGALLDAHIPLRSAEQGKNVPMYRTNLKCRPAGSLSGNTVVSMKPIKATDVAKEVEITSQYPHAHGGPICVGNPTAIGITDLNRPDWGDPIDLRDDEVPVFHACGVTPQSVLMESKVPFAITHKAGYMFVTDLPANCPP